MSRVNIGVLVSGGGTNLQALIDEIHKKDIGNIVLVISNKEEAYGLTRANMENIENIYIEPKDYTNRFEYNKRLIKEMNARNVDLVVLAGYLKILSEDWFTHYRDKIVNIHPSLIPKYCGKGYYGIKVHEAVLNEGEFKTGATVHIVDEGTDTGPILLQGTCDVFEDDSALKLQKRVLEIEHKLLVRAVKYYCENGSFENLGK
ncbi:MAG: phosphoribosylglycinamide formyltransferase [Tissierellales bacterium]|jgi:phosphoribosylglycinamide formyltransferase-1|nr:phosphoribosylglycinamide formyltransferase [Tissierellales bacterium]